MTGSLKISSRSLLAVFLIVAAVLLLYGHTLNVPFYLDDKGALVDNLHLRNLPAVLQNLFSSRSLTSLTFALNYRSTAWALPPLHMVNIALHAACGILVWLLLRRLLIKHFWLPLLGALLFIAHPIQTGAVTYLIQRAAVLGALLFLLAFFLYLRARSALEAGISRTKPAYLNSYAGAVLIGACAVLAKENTATLPLVIIVYDWLFPLTIKRSRRQVTFDYLPFFAVPIALGVAILFLAVFRDQHLIFHNEYIDTLQGNDSLHYFVTQFKVIWIYLRLLIFPYNQALLHNYPITIDLFAWPNLLGLGGILAIVYIAWFLRKTRPVISFGIFWFFLALAVESSFIPLDPLFEHRLYLPLFGILLAGLNLSITLYEEKNTIISCTLVLLFFFPLTWQRNFLWNNPVSFYRDNLRVTPNNAWATNNLGYELKKEGYLDAAIEQYNVSIGINPNNPKTYNNLGVALEENGLPDEAIVQYLKALTINPNDYETRCNLGAAFVSKGHFDPAIREFELAIQINTNYVLAHNNLGVAFLRKGQINQAIREFKKALEIDPENVSVQRNLNAALERHQK